jgi:hypothetical protein
MPIPVCTILAELVDLDQECSSFCLQTPQQGSIEASLIGWKWWQQNEGDLAELEGKSHTHFQQPLCIAEHHG